MLRVGCGIREGLATSLSAEDVWVHGVGVTETGVWESHSENTSEFGPLDVGGLEEGETVGVLRVGDGEVSEDVVTLGSCCADVVADDSLIVLDVVSQRCRAR